MKGLGESMGAVKAHVRGRFFRETGRNDSSLAIQSPLLKEKEDGGDHNTLLKNINIPKDFMYNQMTIWKLFMGFNENMNIIQHFACSDIDDRGNDYAYGHFSFKNLL